MKCSRNMPEVGRVRGIRVMVFYSDHAPPHVHLEKGDDQVVASILEPHLPIGVFTKADRKAVVAWIRANVIVLLANWTLAQAGENLIKIK